MNFSIQIQRRAEYIVVNFYHYIIYLDEKKNYLVSAKYSELENTIRIIYKSLFQFKRECYNI